MIMDLYQFFLYPTLVSTFPYKYGSALDSYSMYMHFQSSACITRKYLIENAWLHGKLLGKIIFYHNLAGDHS